MNKLRSSKGFSRIELICIVGISAVLLFFAYSALNWYHVSQLEAEDKIIANTALHTAEMNTVGSLCPVNSCDGQTSCTHKTEEGYVGYFDYVSNTIYGERKKGYNQYREIKLSGKTYTGEAGSLVIKVVCTDGDIRLFWVKGRRK